MIRWYAVYTQPHGETKALDHLLRQGYPAYLPRYRTGQPRAPALDGSPAALPALSFRRHRPRVDALASDPGDFRRRRRRSRRGCRPKSSPCSGCGRRLGTLTGSIRKHSLRLGELVRVTAGALEDMVGMLVELRDQDRIVVLLEWLGRAVRAQLRAEAVKAA